MAVKDLTRIANALSGVDYIAWLGLTTDDTGEPLEAAKHSDKTVQVVGNFGSTGVITMQGSNVAAPSTNDDDWVTLTDTTETAIELTAKGGALWSKPLSDDGPTYTEGEGEAP